MCGPTVNVTFSFNGGIGGDFYWRRLDNINWISTDATVTITDPGAYINIKENICGFTRNTFNVVALPFAAPLLSDTIFCNQTSNKTFDAGTGWSSISWSTGETTQTITPIITTDGVHNYTLTVSNVCGTYNSGASIEVQHFPNPGFPINVGPYCDTTFIIDPNYTYEYDSYTWSTGDTTRFIYVNDDLSWTVTVTQGGCSKSASRTLRFYEQPLIPEVCVVTVDASMVKNKIVWSSDIEPDAQDPEYKTIEAYNIYKLINDWVLIGTVQATDDHVFTDMSSNPPTQSAMYKITSVDACGSESEKSYYHKTILLLANQGAYPGQISLNWNHYEDESNQFVVSQYYIY
jgi:trimeric autotransporter adhesin